MLSSTGKFAARFDEPNTATQSFAITNPRFAIHESSVFRERGLSTKISWLDEEPHFGAAVRKIPYAFDIPVLEDEFQNKYPS